MRRRLLGALGAAAVLAPVVGIGGAHAPGRFGGLTRDFRMVDFLAFAGVAPAQRGQ